MTAHGGGAVLDIGFGTGTLTARLYAQGCRIYGQDFSERMVQLAQEKMPDAKLYSGDFKQGLVEPLRAQRYDFILATYSLHHLTDAEKVPFLNGLLALLKERGLAPTIICESAGTQAEDAATLAKTYAAL